MTVYNAFSLLGGLALFLYGMTLMGEGLERRAGGRLKKILENLTSNPYKGVLLGMVVTSIIQSSSATTVMLVGFVNSGVMELGQAINVTMGANIGTTITAWILSLTGIESNNFWISLFKPATFTPLLAFAGMVMIFTSKKRKDTATIFLGFAVLMFGMEAMSGAVKGLSQVPEFTNILIMFSNPVLGVLTGAFITAIIQSSSASVGILQAIANTGAVTYGSAIPIILGQNIGTCITAIIASAGANRNAKRVAAVHLAIKIVGAVIFLSVYAVLNSIFRFAAVVETATPVGIAIIHSIYNILNTFLLFPFVKQLEKLGNRLIPDSKEDEEFEMLDERLLGTPSIAIEQCRRLTGEMASLSRYALLLSLEQINNFDPKETDEIVEAENRVDIYEDRIGSYLVQVSMRTLSQSDSRESSKLLHMIGDFERISDHAVNIIEAAREMYDKNIRFSDEASNEVAVLSAAISEILNISVDSFAKNNLSLAEQVEPLEQVIDLLCSEIRTKHIERLQAGICTIELGFILTDILTNLERVADHCSNIAISVIEMETRGTLDAHKYLQNIKRGQASEGYNEMYEGYLEKYIIV